jgi:hypothetical protein
MTYGMPLYMPTLFALGGIGFLAFGAWVVRHGKRKEKWRRVTVYVLTISFCLLLAGVLAPSLAQWRVVLDDQSISDVGGFWFDPSVNTLSLRDVDNLRIEWRQAQDFRGRPRTDRVWVATYRDGSTAELKAGSLLKSAEEEIRSRLADRGIRVQADPAR